MDPGEGRPAAHAAPEPTDAPAPRIPSVRPRRFRLDPARTATVAHVALIVAIGANVTRVTYRAGASLGRDSTIFGLAAHLLDGRIPYGTILNARPPGAYAFEAAVMAVAGRTMGAEHLATQLAGAIVFPLVVYATARTITRPRALALVAALTAGLLVAPAPGVVLACPLIALLLAARWLRSGSTPALLASGITAGAEVVFSLEIAVATIAAVALTIGVRALAGRRTARGTARIRTLQPLIAFTAGAGLGAAAFLVALLADGALGTWLRYVPSTLGGLTAASTYPDAGASLAAARFSLPMLCLPILLSVTARAARFEPTRDEALVGVLFLSASTLRMAVAVADPTYAGLVAAFGDAPLIAVWIAGWLFASRGRIALTRSDATVALGAGIATAAAWRLVPSRPAFVLVPALAALVVAGVTVGPRFHVSTRRQVVRVSALLALLGAAPVLVLASPTRLWNAGPKGARLSGATWPADLAAEITDAGRAMREQTPAGRPALVFPSGGFLYEAIGRPNPTSFPVIGPDIRPWEVRRLLAELARDAPAAVLVRYAQAGNRSARLSEVTAWLEERYVETDRLDAPELWAIWVRREAPEVCHRMLLYPFAGTDGPRRQDVRVGVRSGGRERPILVQRSAAAHFEFVLDRGSFLVFSAEADSERPTAERAIEVVSGEKTERVWAGPADGVLHRIVLPPLPDSRVRVTLLSPDGRPTLWRDPMACSPR